MFDRCEALAEKWDQYIKPLAEAWWAERGPAPHRTLFGGCAGRAFTELAATCMASIFSFTCSCCGQVHEGSPSFAFRAPDPFLEQPSEVQAAGELTSDLCWYDDEDGRHFFIRVCLEIPIVGIHQPFLWGVWVSVSEKSFARYVETYEAPDLGDRYFGWFCNYLPYYPNTYGLKTMARPRAGNQRPSIVPEESDHPLSVDFHQGITIERAQAIAEAAMHRVQGGLDEKRH